VTTERFTNTQLIQILRLTMDRRPLSYITQETGLTTAEVRHAQVVVRKMMANGLSKDSAQLVTQTLDTDPAEV